LSAGGGKRFGKKLYVVAAVVAVAVIAVALLVPQGTASIPLNVDYTVGEKMVYDTTLTTSIQGYDSALPSGLMGASPSDMSVNAQQTIEVIDFDGEYYTLNQTTTMTLGGRPFSYSMLQKMNKAGYSTYIFNLGDAELSVPDASFASNSYLIQLLSRSEVKVGDSITVPFPDVLSNMGVTGDLTMTFRGIEDLTVPAGTYKVFRIDLTSNNVSMNYGSSMAAAGLSSASMNLDINHQMYMEYGTLRQVKSTMEETISYQSSMMNYTMNLSMDMILSQHIKP
jgi:hypothetical protein